MTIIRRTLVSGVAAAAIVTLALTGCTPGSGGTPSESADPNRTIETDVSAMGDLTLTVWDQEVRGGQNEQMTQLNKAFEDKYPNITIKRNSQSFEDLGKTLRLALSGNEAPDVVQANNARNSMGAFVTADQLLPLDAYADAYKWEDRFPESVLQYSQYSPDGKTFGSGSVYGLPQVGEIVGVFYSKKKLAEIGVEVPKDWATFETALGTAKTAGTTPLLLGNIEKWPAVHVFGPVQGAYVDSEEIQKLGFGNPGASWTTPENEEAASVISSWQTDGYFNEGVNGTDYDAAWQDLSKGQGAFLIGGSWLAADLEDAMGDDVGFFAPPADAGEGAHTTGGTGLPFTVTKASKNPDLAAAYIDFITNDDAMKILADTGNLPVVNTQKYAPESGVQHDVFATFGSVTTDGVLLPYLDYATPTFGDTLGEALQGLLDGQLTPKTFTETLETDYAEFTSAG
ncbi:ABC transporter substrate-binding protein [Lysinibacter cavernae]|uniref:Raffinose/stachyose/melibiose transport system substrate-binding protein n=1 Tax=Lysinibacter cavernae TaxID=1640652 RepID=A0A7X5QZN0_9MICO|nr:extracellular solute-binding protein [Lysinibacter cavernae]NIH52938.1 raffinose/stachyose/melibiose transport system substrate-binding protein [Lysinibacter cavernae]